MGVCSTRGLFNLISGGLICVSIQGCAIFSSSSDSSDGNAFRGSASAIAPNNPIPLPLEIAADIAVLAAGGQVAPVNPAVVPMPATKPAPIAAATPSPTPEVDKPVLPATSANKSACVCDEPGEVKKVSSVKMAKRRPSSKSKKSDVYMVRDGDTLMKISFEKYGNVYRWREIYNANRSKIANYNRLEPGTVLNILGVEYIVIERNGQPYLIKKNDTLVKISRGLYGSSRYWKNLWDNNRQLIRDPNKIYAGFTLYYLPMDGIPVKVGGAGRKPGPLRSRLPAGKK